ncbi:MAG TPA: class I SAM-dependent methyltransferase [Roseomonas sp.]|jgi:SAM-dependent methyltransferase
MSTGYHATRFAPDPRRDVLWQSLWRFHYRHMVSPQDCVLDLGAGYGSFINQVAARRRIAVDAWPDFRQHLAPGVEGIVGSAADLSFLDAGCVDLAFASNLFEHLSREDFVASLAGLRRIVSPRGRLVILQPNWRFAWRRYFDDYTHVAIWSDAGLADFLEAEGFEVLSVAPRFLPLSIKSRLPVHPWLIAAYLASPLKPFGGQMQIVARPRP